MSGDVYERGVTSERVRVERRGALAGPKVAETDVSALDPDARAALDSVLAQPVAAPTPTPGGDRIWYRITRSGADGMQMRDVTELPEALRTHDEFRF